MKKAEIHIAESGKFFLSFGDARSNSEFKSFAGAARYAERLGYAVGAAPVESKLVPSLFGERMIRIPVAAPAAVHWGV
jgi:hypothetical protein